MTSHQAQGRRHITAHAAPSWRACFFTPDELHQVVVDARAVWQEEAAAGAQRVEEEELLLRAHIAVVTLLGLLDAVLVLLQLLLVCTGVAEVEGVQG